MPRVVSLIASATEIVCALGFEEHLVGRSHECDFPLSIQHLPVCTEPRFNVNGSSREIDQRVKDTLRDAVSVYHVHGDVLKELRPDVVVTQAHCEVCAVSLKDVERTIGEWVGFKPRVVSLEPNSLDDVWQNVHMVAEALDVASGQKTVARLQERMAEIEEQTGRLERVPTVACLEWLDPLMAIGNWMPELVKMAGGENQFGKAGEHSPWMSWEDLRRSDPEHIIAMPCGFDLAKTNEELKQMMCHPYWTELRAVKENKVFVTDGNQYFNRPGPRLVESLEILAEILHPDKFQFGHEGTGWQRV